MKDQKRGSEKLMASCTGISTLSAEELEQVAGGALASTQNNFWRVFPHGVPWPDLYQQLKMDPVEVNPDQFQTPGYL